MPVAPQPAFVSVPPVSADMQLTMPECSTDGVLNNYIYINALFKSLNVSQIMPVSDPILVAPQPQPASVLVPSVGADVQSTMPEYLVDPVPQPFYQELPNAMTVPLDNSLPASSEATTISNIDSSSEVPNIAEQSAHSSICLQISSMDGMDRDYSLAYSLSTYDALKKQGNIIVV
jgi:hypothetical protein